MFETINTIHLPITHPFSLTHCYFICRYLPNSNDLPLTHPFKLTPYFVNGRYLPMGWIWDIFAHPLLSPITFPLIDRYRNLTPHATDADTDSNSDTDADLKSDTDSDDCINLSLVPYVYSTVNDLMTVWPGTRLLRTLSWARN